MKIHEWLKDHPDDQLRVIMYVPAPDVQDENGNWVIGGEGTSTVVFDSTTGDGDFPPDLMMKDIINSGWEYGPGEDGAYELEFMPDECYDLY